MHRNSKDVPCYKCLDREISCHSTCERYLKFKNQVRLENEKYAEFINDGGAVDFLARNAEKTKREKRSRYYRKRERKIF